MRNKECKHKMIIRMGGGGRTPLCNERNSLNLQGVLLIAPLLTPPLLATGLVRAEGKYISKNILLIGFSLFYISKFNSYIESVMNKISNLYSILTFYLNRIAYTRINVSLTLQSLNVGNLLTFYPLPIQGVGTCLLVLLFL